MYASIPAAKHSFISESSTLALTAIIKGYRGISLIFGANDNTLVKNVVSENEYGIHLASACLRNTILKNSIVDNSNGVYFFVDSSNNQITANTITHNNYGVTLEGAGFNFLTENNITDNTVYGIRLIIRDEYWEQFWANGNQIYHNNFISNAQQAYDECYNTWDNEYPSGGNYWSDYRGVDINPPDGIGDTPYNITGIDPPNQDNYPFMNPSGWMTWS